MSDTQGYPDQGVDTQGNLQPSASEAKPSLMSRWNDWLSKPENRSVLINSGLAMLQPAGPGESGLGHAAEAIGSGFEARDQLTMQRAALQKEAAEQARIQQQTVSEGDLRSAQADYYRAHAKYLAAGGAGGSGIKTIEEWRKEADTAQRALNAAEADNLINPSQETTAEIAHHKADYEFAIAQVKRLLQGGGEGETTSDQPSKDELITEAKVRLKADPSKRAIIERTLRENGVTDLSVLDKP